MAQVRKNITINAPLEKVFSYVDDPMNQLEWLPGMTDVREIAGDGVGRRFSWTYKMMGMSFKGKTEVIDYVSNERYVIKSTGGIQSTWTWTFQPETSGTLLSLTVEYTIPVPLLGKVAERLVLQQNEREAHMAMTNLKERLEG